MPSSSDFGREGRKKKVAVSIIGAVSPAALATANIAPVRMPGTACGSTLCLIVCHLVAPKASDPSRKDFGTLRRASLDADITTGSTNKKRERAPERIDVPNPR